MELGPFLKERRLQQGHGTIGALASFAKALGMELSRESIRLFENERKVPNPTTRKLLCNLLRLSVYQKYTLEKLCAEAHIKNKFEIGPAMLVDEESAGQLAGHISNQTKLLLEDLLPIDSPATEEDIDEIKKKVEELCKVTLSPFETQVKSI